LHKFLNKIDKWNNLNILDIIRIQENFTFFPCQKILSINSGHFIQIEDCREFLNKTHNLIISEYFRYIYI